MDALNGRIPHARLPLFEALRDAAVKGPITFADILDSRESLYQPHSAKALSALSRARR
jgi:hypothetical protein